MKCLKDDAEIATGDPTQCESCKAYFNKHSKLEGEESGKQKWVCEFCNFTNFVQIEQEEIPKQEAVNYILEAAPIKEKTHEEEKGEQTTKGKEDEISIVYCIDISGSMDGRSRGANNQIVSRLHAV